jgi:hypothetical protein
MKVLCFDTDYCGYEEKISTASKENIIDLNSKIIECPSCKESIAIIEEDDFYFQKHHDKTQQIHDFISILEKIIKL